MSGELRLCLVGAGPRGTSVVERLLANVDGPRQVVLHVVDEFPAGPGAVWRTRQRTGLLMNTVASQVSMFTDDSVRCEGPIVPGPSLYDWSTWLRDGELPGVYPAWVREEADRLGPDEYPSRAFYGHYLQWVFRRVVAGAPEQVSVVVHTSAAVALDDSADGKQTLSLRDGTVLSGLDGVALALGHGPVARSAEQERLSRFAETRKLIYLEQANPADTETRRFMPGEAVALRGLGLNFFDYLNLLTVERGGVYERHGTSLRYVKSGLEPQLFAGSRRGIPYHARGENQKGASGRHVPLFLTEAKIRELRTLAPVAFAESVWPLVDLEVKAVYYQTLCASEKDGQAFVTEFVRTRDEEPLLERYGITERWSWERISRPQGDREFADTGEFTAWLLDYLRADVEQARMGNRTSPLKSALDVLRDLRNEIRQVVDHGGIGGESYRDELERWYNPLNAYTSIGPPARRIEEMIALIEAGVLRMTGPGMTVEPGDDCFLVGSSIPSPAVPVTGLIEARLPEIDLRRTGNPLLRHLLTTGQCRPYRLPGGAYESGGLSVTARPYRVIDALGRPHPARFAFGVPTEGVHWVTAAGIRPGVGSVTLEDADAIARAALALDATVPV
ncbi:FAD-NAD(P)-binding [Amycolatopsis xylanica]|uniref:FAD-NAD(P)-binding n=1 Tax=Amycolatopsis xylanica TaxID=589385 RepID=A0A1H2V2T8_9PSEU|nr:FAD/NAD(P)-binding protein [Amycolatopsis xylanica]SDW62638.1 FAD-NAD(P)-binding [Amycolatopsis xylanica]